MHSVVDLLHRLMNVEGLLTWAGPAAMLVVTAIIFAETGLLVGFFLPGDSLLVTAGLFASQAATGVHLKIWLLAIILPVAAILGNTVGYFVGKAAGPRLFTREDSLLFNRKHLRRAHAFYERHGGKTLVLARFMPIVRTFVPVVAGAADMNLAAFTLYNVVGGVLWIWSMLFLGYYLGNFEWVRANVEKVILLVIFVSILPGIIGWLRRDKSASTPPARDSIT